MQLHQQGKTLANTVTGYGDDYVEINKQRYTQAVYFRPHGEISTWSVSGLKEITYEKLLTAAGITPKKAGVFDFLNDENPPVVFENAPEIFIIGTGSRQIFLDPALLQPFIQARIGVECMDTHAAARTYNVLMAEDRQVAVALLPFHI